MAQNNGDVSKPGVSRRDVLRFSAIGAFGLAAAPLLAACSESGGGTSPTTSGGGASPTTSGAPAPSPSIKPGGTLRVALSGGSPGSTADPNVIPDPESEFYETNVYNQLCYRAGDYKMTNDLAEEITPNADGTEWTIRLKDGVEFHNAKTLDADDVIFTIKRIQDPKTVATAGATFALIKSATKVDSRTVKLTMTGPTGWVPDILGDGGITGIVPVGFDPAKPVGTGPYKIVSRTAGTSGSLTRFENYFGDKPLADALEMSVINDDSARINALLSGQADVLLNLPPTGYTQLQGNSQFATYDQPSGSFYPITMRVDDGVTKDVRVRQALRMVIDREAVVNTAFGGHARIGNDLYAPDDSGYDKSLVRKRDVAGAKQLVQQAGADGASIEIVASDLFPGIVAQCQILAENAKEIGLNVTVKTVDPGTLYGPNYLSWPVAIDIFPALTYMSTSALVDGPTAVIDETHFSNAKYNDLWKSASSALDEAERNKSIGQMQKILFDEGGYIIAAFPNTLLATSASVGGYPAVNLTALEQYRALPRMGFYS